MNVTESIIQAMLLGTANRECSLGEFPEALETLIHEIREKSEDTETFLCMSAASAFAYARAGWEPSQAEDPTLHETAPAEEFPYFDNARNAIFSRLQGSRYMLVYAYRKALTVGKIISPELLQALIRRAYDRNNPLRFEERRALQFLAGKRGPWLVKQMGLADPESEQAESWETAAHGERRELLRRYRMRDPAAALDLLRKDWKSEPANHRNELLECLRTNLSRSDESFLQEVMTADRSATVRDTACKLLCGIPDSALVIRCCELLRGHVNYKMLIGWSYDKMEYTPEMKSLGLSEISQNKRERDSEFILRQLAERVPLHFWCDVFGCNMEQAAGKLVKHPPFRGFFRVEEPILHFSDRLWAFYTLKEDPSCHRMPELVGLLAPAQREEIDWPEEIKDFGYIPDSWYGTNYETWGPRFSTSVLSWLLKQQSLYSAAETAEHLALYLFADSKHEIEVRAASLVEATPSINEFLTKIQEFMDLKSKTDTLFND